SAPMVTTPVPPMPVTKIFQGRSRSVAKLGMGSTLKSTAPAPAFFAFFRPPPCTVTKLGQKPFTQERSLLQPDWSISRLRPYSVVFGSTDTQNDFSPQSPQPSQT